MTSKEPHIVHSKTLCIEASTICQLRCPTCPTTSNGYPPVIGAGYLRFPDFKKIIQENPWIKNIKFINLGEMFLNPDLDQIINFASNLKINMYCDGGVNLNSVKPGVLDALVRGKHFKTLFCSIDGASPETYAMYRRGGDFNNVTGSIEEINRLKKLYGSKYPKLFWQFVVFGHNEHEIPLARSLAKKLDMEFMPKLSWDSSYSPVKDVDFVKSNTGWKYVTREDFERGNKKNYVRATCYMLFENPRVNWDGKILGCCWNNWGDFGGNAFIDGYKEATGNPKMRYALQMLLGKVPARDDIPCYRCELYLNMVNRKNFLTIDEIRKKYSRIYNLLKVFYRILPRSWSTFILNIFRKVLR